MKYNRLFQQSVKISSTDYALPENGVTAPKYVGAILM